MNSSQAIDAIQTDYPILHYPIWIVFFLIIIAVAIIVAKKMAERSGEDLYDYAKKKWRKTEVKEAAVVSDQTSLKEPLQEFALCISLPQRNLNFTGREAILKEMEATLASGRPSSWKQVLCGLGGKGKSQIALEYGYRHRNDYRFIWWLPSEEPATLRSNYAALAMELDLMEKESFDLSVAVVAVKQWLENNSSWLIFFDNALEPGEIEPYLPSAEKGHVVITSRNPNWGGLAEVIPVDIFSRKESIQFLLKRTKRKDADAAGLLAEALGDLPLALEQAGAYMEETAISFADYLSLFQEQRTKLLAKGKPTTYSETVASTWEVSIQAAQKKIPESLDLLRFLAFMSPENVPRSQLLQAADRLPEPLCSALQNRMRSNDTIAALRSFSLINASHDAISVHRLVQEVTLASFNPDLKRHWLEAVIKLIESVFPNTSHDIASWAVCDLWLPHSLAALNHAEELGIETATIASLLNKVGLHLGILAQFRDEKVNLQKALAIGEKVYGPDHPQVAIYANNLGGVLKSLGDLQGAKKHYERALAIGEKVYGPDHPQVATYANNLGLVLKSLGDLQGAKKHYERALAIDEKVYGPDHPDVAIGVNNLGLVLESLGDLQGAKKHYERALAIDEKVYGPDHPTVAIRVNNLGGVLESLGDLQGAKKHYERALAIGEKVYGPDHPTVAIRVNNLGGVLKSLGDLQGAKKHYERALQIFQKSLGENHTNTKTVQENLNLLEKESKK